MSDEQYGYLSDEEAAKLKKPGPICQNCRFWDELEPPTWGETSPVWSGWCHRFPPTFRDNASTPDEDYRQPVTSHADWCGEFQPISEGSR